MAFGSGIAKKAECIGFALISNLVSNMALPLK